MYIGQTSRSLLRRKQHIFEIQMPILARVIGSVGIPEMYFAWTRSSSDDGPVCLVESVFLDCLPHHKQVLSSEWLLSRAHDGFVIPPCRHLARIRMIVMTIINSSRSETPPQAARSRFCDARGTVNCPDRIDFLPVRIFRSVRRCALGLRVHVEDVASAPAMGVRVILDGAQAPIGLSRSSGQQGSSAEIAPCLAWSTTIDSKGCWNLLCWHFGRAREPMFQPNRIALCCWPRPAPRR